MTNTMSQGILLTYKCDPVPAPRPRTSFTSGHHYMPKAYKSFITMLKYSTKRQLASDWRIIGGPCAIEIEFGMRRPKTVKREWPCVKPDVDNLTKSVLDAMNKIVFEDDGQVIELMVRKVYAEGDPYIKATVGFSRE